MGVYSSAPSTGNLIKGEPKRESTTSLMERNVNTQQKYQIRQEPNRFCTSLVKSEPT